MVNIKELIEDIIVKNYKDPDYELRTALSEEILLHSTGEIHLIHELLSTRFPSEPWHIMEYRLQNIARITKTYFNKIVTTLAKIERADDYVIKFKDTNFQTFCEEQVTEYKDLSNWFFRVGLKKMLEEPNGFVLVFPEFDSENEDLLTGISLQCFDAKQIVYLSEDRDLIVVQVNKDSYLIFDNDSIVNIIVEDRFAKKLKYKAVTILEHNLGRLPVVFFGGLVYKTGHNPIHESFISGVVPFWNQAMIEFNDKQAGIKQHLFPEKWRYISGTCPDCNGNGKKFFDGVGGKLLSEACHKCGGTGDPPTGQFSEILIQPGQLLDKDIPKPPVGYVQKDFSAIEYLDKDIKNNLYAGLAAVNMEFLMERPIDQSGVSKEMDRQELNSFIFQIASHVTQNILTPIYRLIAEWYYWGTNTNIEAAIPGIKTPVHYDYLTTDNYESTVTRIRQAGVSPYIVQALERRYIEKQFENFTDDQNYLLTINKLDPLPAYTFEQKEKLFKSGAVTRRDFICSVNIEPIMKQIMWDRVKFYNFDYNKQVEILYQYTDKLIQIIDNENEQQNQPEPVSESTESGNLID